MNIAVGGIAHETNTFSTLPTDIGDFSVSRGDEILSHPLSRRFWHDASKRGYTPYPILHARATPSGKVTERCFRGLLAELIDGITAAGSLAGVLLFLHGAMEVEGIGDGETAILTEVRKAVGEEILVAVTLDLHANLAPEVARMADIITAYRTAPHRDAAETQVRGAELLVHCVEQHIRPSVVLKKLPLLVAGEAAVTEVSPAKDLYAALPGLIEKPGILDASILIGCAWTDSPYTTVSALACGVDCKAQEQVVDRIAADIWARKDEFVIDSQTASTEDSIRIGLDAPVQPVFVSDSGDNPTAGAAGDSPMYLKSLLSNSRLQRKDDTGARILVAGIADGVAVSACGRLGIGETAKLNVGGKLDSVFAAPLDITGEIISLFPNDPKFGDVAIVGLGRIDLVLQTARRPFTEMGDFVRLGLSADEYQIVVVKLGYLFPELRDYAPKHIMALSPGFGDQRIDTLPYKNLTRPIYPLDPGARPDLTPSR